MSATSRDVGRARGWTLVVVSSLAFFAALLVTPGSARSGSPAVSDGENVVLQQLLELPGDQVVVVPDGVYQGVSVDTSRPETDGALDGWLVLEAETRGGVVVRGELELNSPTSRILFVGFRFENARVFNRGEHIAYWYTDHVYPDVDWHAEGRPIPRQIFMHSPASDISVLGSDFHDAVASPINITGVEGIRLAGVRIWNLSEPPGSDPEDRSHLNTISMVGGDVSDMVVSDSTLVGARANHQTDKGDVVGLRYENVWYEGGWGAAFQFNATQGHRIVDSFRTDVRSWGHVGNNPQDRLDVVAGEQLEPGARPADVDVLDVNLALQAPDESDVDPASRWRAEHPYESWQEFFGWTPAPRVGTGDASKASGEIASAGPNVGVTSMVVAAAAVLLLVAWRWRRRNRWWTTRW